MLKIVLSIITVTLIGCATSSGIDITEEQLAKLKVGLTTEQDVVKLLGPPLMRTTTNGLTISSYSKVNNNFGSGTSKLVMFHFGADAKLTNTTVSTSSFGQTSVTKP